MADVRHQSAPACDASFDAEQLYAQATDLQKQDCASCVDLYFEVAVLTSEAENCARKNTRLRKLHDSALRQLVIAGQKYRRLDPAKGLTVYRAGGEQVIPIRRHGFVREAKDFQRLILVGDYKAKALSNYHRCTGVGIPLVVTGCPSDGERFSSQNITFAATMRLNVQPFAQQSGFDPALVECQLELYDPLRVDHVDVYQHQQRLAKDLSAPIAYRLSNRRSNILSGFIRPGAVSPDSGSSEGNLYTLEPYQAGKIPVVLIHGLLSDRFTWAETVNELMAKPGFVDRFQLWVFEYPTGRPFLGSAADLREQLDDAVQTFDPLRSDPQLSNMVLVGHSMGGLVAKLQITSSGDRLWRAVANRPIDQISVSDEYRDDIISAFYFRPSPYVSRVVFIATPHRGSAFATRLIGRVASCLVTEPEQRRQQHRRLIANNPGVFTKEVSRRIPTSVDLLEPGSPLLQAMEKLPVGRDVKMHSVIGDKCFTLSLGRSDGIVPVVSAREPRAVSELMVKATHSATKERPKTIRELFCILDQHLQRSCAKCVEPIAAIVEDPAARVRSRYNEGAFQIRLANQL